MGRNDNRRSLKMRRKIAQKKAKARRTAGKPAKTAKPAPANAS